MYTQGTNVLTFESVCQAKFFAQAKTEREVSMRGIKMHLFN